MGYTIAMWLGFGGALAAVAGALTGLLFVAVSIYRKLGAASRSQAVTRARELGLLEG